MTKKSNLASDVHRKLKTTPIAIVGLSAIFPQAHNVDEYWDNILNKVNCITDVPASRWSLEDYYDPDPNTPDKSYCKRGGFIPDIDFDPMEFGLPPNILEVTDVSQLLALVAAKEALEDAGYGESREFNRDLTGVILGVVGMSSKLVQPLLSRLQAPVWEKVLRNVGVPEGDIATIVEKFKAAYVGWEENAFPGTIVNVIAGRICNRFDLGGTNCVIDAACASSLAAVRMAVMELSEGRADMMITGGVDVDNSILTYLCFSKTPAFSKGEVVKAFDAGADGMLAGEGIGMLVLKRLADAERDGDRIYATIRGIGSSSDGRFKSIYAPRSEGQAKALRRAYEDAGFAPATVGIVEAHGTGTMAGDPAEFNGMNLVFGENNPHRQYIGLGSIKSQIAHTKSTAGAASLIKMTLALHHKVLPATINVTQPNPKLDIENTPFYLSTETRPWIRPEGAPPRRAGVSAFGFGGTNHHVVLEEYAADHAEPYRRNRVPQMIILDAATQAMLVAKSQDTLAGLQAENGQVLFSELGQAGQEREIPLNQARIGFVAETREEAVALLQTAIELMQDRAQDEAWESPKGIFYRKSGIDPHGKVVALFPGQGAQYVEMGRELAVNFPSVRQAFAQMDGLFLAEGEEPLSGKVFPIPVFDPKQRDAQNEIVTKTQNAQPAIGTLSLALYQILQQGGFRPDFCAGHSFGELTALWASGVVSEKDYYALAKARGKAMAPPADPNFDAGTMLAVKGDVEQIRQEIAAMPGVTLANWNSKNQVVLAGSKPVMVQAQQALSDKGFSAIPLSVSAAFHTPLVGHAQKPFAGVIAQTPFQKPGVRVFSNSTGQEHSADPKAIQQLLSDHILNPVLWKAEIEAIYAAGGYFFVECGPKNILTNLVDNILADQPHIAVALNPSPKKDSDRQLREAVVKLKVAGLNLGRIDPFQSRVVMAPKKRSAVTVKLNGGLFVSEKTRRGFEKALNDGFKLVQPRMVSPEPVRELAAAAPAPVAVKVIEAPAPAPVAPVVVAAPAGMINAVEQALTRLQTQQSAATHVHEQYLSNDSEYGRIFSQVTQMGVSLVSNPNANPQQIDQALTALQSIERSMMRFHDHQAETLRAHEQYLKSQEEFAQQYVGLVRAQFEALKGSPATYVPAPVPQPVAVVAAQPIPAPVAPVAPRKPLEEVRKLEPQVVITPPVAVEKPKNGNGHAKPVIETPAPVVVVAPASSAQGDVQQALLGVVSEKTGYPPEMLDLTMDMEADLGIDSIKRVEILGAMRAIYPALPKVAAEDFGEMRTLTQVIEHIRKALPETANVGGDLRVAGTANVTTVVGGDLRVAPGRTTEIPEDLQVEAPVAVAANPSNGPDMAATLLAVVSEKTGYPTEMLELNMDMEADLGIDSIKKVEIMGAMRQQYPSLSKADPEAFAEARTLGQVVTYLGTLAEATSTPF
jgi:polyketide-type polyunsaturated fatty acid synthase PfaA